jgi:DNA polymerase (family 10)
VAGIDIKGAGRASAICIAPRPCSKPPKRISGGITPAGDFRRGCELVSDLSLVAEVPMLDGEKTREAQLTVPLWNNAAAGDGLSAARRWLARPGRDQRLKARRQGLRRGHNIVAAKVEEDIYAALGLPFTAPELREGQGEIQWALKRKLPSLADAHSTDEIDHTHWGVGRARVAFQRNRC